jgi:hypothetical protein
MCKVAALLGVPCRIADPGLADLGDAASRNPPARESRNLAHRFALESIPAGYFSRSHLAFRHFILSALRRG